MKCPPYERGENEMTFVFPILLGGLALAGLPILLHLIMRQKPKTLPFPAFRFLMQRRRTNLRKLRLRHLLLLAFRVLLIVLICLALGRPRVFNQGLNLSSERPVAAVLVFDTSPSMAYQSSDKRSRLDEAKKRGQEFVTELPEGSRVVILDSATTVGSNRGDWLLSMGEARKRIDDLRVRPNAASVLPTVAYAYRILGELARDRDDDRHRYLPRFVCVFSDRTRASWDAGKQGGAQTAADQVAPTLEGLQAGRADISPLVDLLKELRAKLPPPPGRDYPEQALIEALEQLAPLLPTLTKEDLPPDAKLAGLTETIQRRGRDLLDMVRPSDEKTANKDAPDEFRAKLIANLQGVLRDVRGAQGLFIDVGMDKPVDLAITQLELPTDEATSRPREVFGSDEKIVLRATVQATGEDISTKLTCRLDNKKLLEQPAEVKAGARQTIPLEIDGAALKLTPGPHQVEVRLDPPDLLAFNNRFYLTFAISRPRRVLVLRDDNDAARAVYFINALEKNGFAVQAKAPSALPELRDYQAVYLFEVPAPTPQVWNYLLDGVHGGIGLGIVLGGQETDKAAYNSADAQKLMPAQLAQVIEQGKDDGQNPGAFWDLDDASIYQHPLMRPFRDWQIYDLVKNPRWAFAFWDVDKLAKNSLAVVRYKDAKRHPALLERALAADGQKLGKVVLFTTPLDGRKPRWNNYLENSMFVGLNWLVTNYLAGASAAPRLNFICGRETPTVSLPSARFLHYALLKDGNLMDKIAAPDGQSQLKLPQADAPGNYVLEGLDGDAAKNQAVAAFSVNVAAEESDLSRVPQAAIESLFGPDAVVPVDRRANIRDVLKGHWNEPVELFPLLMAILLLVLAVENLLANKFYRRDNEAAAKT